MAVVQDFLDCSKWQQLVADLESAKGERKRAIGGEEMFPALKRDRNGHGNDNCLKLALFTPHPIPVQFLFNLDP